MHPLDINPPPYFKDACNQFGFGLILKSKDQLSIFDNSASSSTSVFSSTIFKKWLKALFLGGYKPLFLEHLPGLREHLEPSYLQNPCRAVLLKNFTFSIHNANMISFLWHVYQQCQSKHFHLICCNILHYRGILVSVLKSFKDSLVL